MTFMTLNRPAQQEVDFEILDYRLYLTLGGNVFFH